MVKGRKEVGKAGEQSYKRDGMSLLAKLILENSHALFKCSHHTVILLNSGDWDHITEQTFSSTQNALESNLENG